MAMVNNIFAVIFGKESNVSRDTNWKMIALRTTIRIVCALLPIVVAMWISNLAYILQYAGLIGFFIAFFFPTILQLASQRVCCKTFQEIEDSKKSEKSDKDSAYDSATCESENRNGDLTSIFEHHDRSSLVVSFTQSVQEGEHLPLLHAKRATSQCKWVYPTPYSTCFSHPACVVVIGLVATSFFLASVVSVFVEPL